MKTVNAFLSAVCAILALVSVSAAAEDPAYRFEVDGKPRDLWVRSVFGEADKPAPGDFIYVGDIPQVLGEPGDYRFETTPEEDGRLFRVDDEGKKTVVGAAVEWTYEDDKVIFNPLKKLTPEQLRGLRGVHLDTWEPDLEKFLAQLDGKKVANSITEGAGDGDHLALAKSDKLKTASELDAHLLDFMVDDVRRAKKGMTSGEKEKLDHYLNGFEALRDRRVKLATLDDSVRVHIPSITDKYTSPVETHRLEAHFDMAAASLIAGLTNVITVDADDLEGHYSGLGLGEKSVHGIGHLSDDFKKGRDTNFADGTDGVGARDIVRKYQLDLIAGLAEKLRAVPEGDGTMLDRTLIVFFSDAGHQHHANYQHFPLLTVGNVGGKLKTGRYLHFPSYGEPENRTLGSFYLSLLQASGKPRNAFGQIDLKLPKTEQTEPLKELFA